MPCCLGVGHSGSLPHPLSQSCQHPAGNLLCPGCWVCVWVRGRRRGCSLGGLHRFIKRKKFDDELVESSLAKSSTRAKGASAVEPGRCSGSEPSSSEKKKVKDWEILGGGWRGWNPAPDFVFPHSLCQLGRVLLRRLMREPNCPSLNLRCLPRIPSLPTPPYLLQPHSENASCITFCVGGM